MAVRVSLHFFPVWFTVHHSNGNSGMVQSKLQCAVLELCTIMLFSYQIDFEMSGQARGNMTFGIIQGREIIDGANGELLQDATFYTCKLIKFFDHDGINFLVQLRDLAMLLILLHSTFFSCVCCSPFLYRWLTCASNLSTRIKL